MTGPPILTHTFDVQLCGLDEASAAADLMKNIKHDGRNVSSCKAANWPNALPVRGMLTFDFSSKRVRKVVHVMEQKKFQVGGGGVGGGRAEEVTGG